MASTVKDVDKGALAVLLNAGTLKSMRLRVGIPENAGNYPNGTPIAQVAAAHEFGTEHVPQRAFIRGWFDEMPLETLTKPFTNAANQILKGEQKRPAVLNLIAHYFAQSMKDRILRHIPPPLQPATIARKERNGADLASTPLVDTHVLLNAIKGWTP